MLKHPFTRRRWRLTGATVALVISSQVAACGERGPESESAPQDEPVEEGIQITAGLDRASYAPGDTVRVVIRLGNRLGRPRTLAFPTSQRYDLVVLREPGEEEVHRWSDGRAFAQASGVEELPPGGNGPTWREVLQAPSEPGEYTLRAEVPLDGAILRTELPLLIHSAGDGVGASAGLPLEQSLLE